MKQKRARPEKRSEEANDFYDQKQTKRYTSERNEGIQRDLTLHALRMLGLWQGHISAAGKKQFCVLDMGCGSGLSSSVLEEVLPNGFVIGFDVSAAMLAYSNREPCVENGVNQKSTKRSGCADFVMANADQHFPFKHRTFDLAISISMVQWLCVGDKCVALKRLDIFYRSLFNCLTSSGQAVLQVYPETADHCQMLVDVANMNGFIATLVSDFPHSTAAKKYFVCLKKAKDNAVKENAKECIQCPFGIRFKISCAMSWWENCVEDPDCRMEPISKLMREHIRHAHKILRKVGRVDDLKNAERLSSLNRISATVPVHPKAILSLQLSEYERTLAHRLRTELFSSHAASISLQDLQAHSDSVLKLIHTMPLCELNN